jgi:signal transduction histidine kinase/ActR/RegA family two-component response regulator
MIFGWFGKLRSFGDKVTWLVTLTSGVATLTVSLTLALVDYSNQWRETLDGLQSQTMIVAMNSGAPLAFADRYSANEALAAFSARPAVAKATLYDVNGARFATYLRSPETAGKQAAPALQDRLFVNRWHAHTAAVEDRGQLLGRIDVLYDLRDLQRHLMRSLALSVLVSLLVVTMVYLVSLRLNKVLVKPIALLSQTARKVSETKDYSLRATKVSDDEMGVFTDTFNQMLAQIQKQDVEIQASRADALHASQLKDEFLATLSHELRTPMTPILGWAQILRRSAYGNEQVLQAAEVIERNARAQNKIIDDLLEMSRIVSGKIRLDVQAIDLASVVAEAVDTVATAAQARGIELRTDLEPGLPLTRGDPHRLQQVVWNLLSNAIKFTQRGGQVQVALRRSGQQLEISVSDTGQGIAGEFLPHVFERFRQADSSNTRHHSGLGLGLSIVKQLVELHGGSVRASSDGEGQGACFTVSLPVLAVSDQARPLPTPARAEVDAPVLPGAIDLRGLKLLLVDDEQDGRQLVEHMLRGVGAEVVSVDSAQAAMQALQGFRPDALVSDIGMPGENGYELIQRIRALPESAGGTMPAVALTAFARAEDRQRALEAGFQLHVAKPVEQADLLAALATLDIRRT